MAWEKRKRSTNLFYTRTQRIGKKRKRTYFGTGPIAELASVVDLLKKIDRELDRRDVQKARTG